VKTVILQTYVADHVPDWITRCITSVRDWATARGYDHRFSDDGSVFALCGAEYLHAVGDNKRSVTNLARLLWIRESLAAGYDRAIWLDADVFIFNRDTFELNIASGYAFGREIWIGDGRSGPWTRHCVLNAFIVFAGHHPDLDLMIDLTRYIASSRALKSNCQLGVHLLSGLHAGLRFPLAPHAAQLSPDMIRAIARNRRRLLRAFARLSEYPIGAANLCALPPAETVIMDHAMDRLEISKGQIINRYMPGGPSPFLVPDSGTNNQPIISLAFPLQAIKQLLPPKLLSWFRRRRAAGRVQFPRFNWLWFVAAPVSAPAPPPINAPVPGPMPVAAPMIAPPPAPIMPPDSARCPGE
jgi:hypothetical protein